MPSKLRLIHYGLGPIGSAIVRLITERGGADIIGAIDIDPAKVGRDLGEVVGLDHPLGVRVSDRADDILGQRADVVIHSTSSYLEKVIHQLFSCIEAGSHVISTCEELAYPFRKYPELSRDLAARAEAAGVAVLGTGVNPGFVMDKLVLTLVTVCQQIDTVFVERVVNASERRLPLQRKIGAGLTPDEFSRAVEAGTIKHHGLPESAAMIADALGFALDDLTETIEPILADEDLRTEYLEVKRGFVAGVRQVCRGLSDGRARILLDLRMAVGATDPHDAISIKGYPDISLRIPGGIHGDLATAAVVVNTIPLIVAARPGLRTVIDIPVRFSPTM